MPEISVSPSSLLLGSEAWKLAAGRARGKACFPARVSRRAERAMGTVEVRLYDSTSVWWCKLVRKRAKMWNCKFSREKYSRTAVPIAIPILVSFLYKKCTSLS